MLVVQIKSEQGIASGIRRIEAVAGPAALEYLDARDSVVKDLSSRLKVSASDLPYRVAGLFLLGLQPFLPISDSYGVSQKH